MSLRLVHLPSPLGELRAALRGDTLLALGFHEGWDRIAATLGRRFGGDGAWPEADAPALRRALARYFEGALDALSTWPLDPGGTAFQRAVWDALRRVPAGGTTFYGALARAIGQPGAARAVGAACGANPIWLAIPCHRAIGNDGRLVGYAGGLARKRWLLHHEGALPLPDVATAALLAATPPSARRPERSSRPAAPATSRPAASPAW